MPTGSHMQAWSLAAPILGKALKVTSTASKYSIIWMMLALEWQLLPKSAIILQLLRHTAPHLGTGNAAERVCIANQVSPVHPSGQQHVDSMISDEKSCFAIRIAPHK